MKERIITPEFLLTAYQKGVFPTARDRNTGEIAWCFPKKRGIIPLNRFQIPKNSEGQGTRHPFEIKLDTAFREVVAHCAQTPNQQSGAWISPVMEALYAQLFDKGYAHSIECWKNGKLMGGLFGVSIGGVFFGESISNITSEADNSALVALVTLLREGKYQLLDTQYAGGHLKQFGAQEIPASLYVRLLRRALEAESTFGALVELA